LPEIDIPKLTANKTTPQPEIVVKGSTLDLVFEEVIVLFPGKVVICTNILEAVDLAFKSFYVFNVKFGSASFSACQYLDYSIFSMKTTDTVLTTVRELAAFTGQSQI